MSVPDQDLDSLKDAAHEVEPYGKYIRNFHFPVRPVTNIKSTLLTTTNSRVCTHLEEPLNRDRPYHPIITYLA